jgi:hypothetical protein
MVKQGTDETASGNEYLLLDAVQRLAKNPVGRCAVVMHVSELRPDRRRSHHIRIAVNIFEMLVKQFDGQIFLLSNGDIVFLCKETDSAAVDEAVMRVRYLFGDDPLVSDIDLDGADGFATWYDLGTDYLGFAHYAERMYTDCARRRKRTTRLPAGAGPSAELLPMEPQALTELINATQQADLSNLLRRQSICAVIAGETPMPVFREIYVSIADLRDTIMPKRDITSDRWLFKYLTQTLDKRVLALLRRNDDSALAHSFSLNLNVSTLLSPEFLAFDASLRSGARGSIVIEIEKLEIFADLGAYLFARDFVRERGYRLCLDGATLLTLPFIERERLGLDLVKVFWSPEMADADRGGRREAFDAALDRIGKPRVILARCDTPAAIGFGLAAGVRLFQGRYVDHLVELGAIVPASTEASPSRAAGR